MIKKQIFPILAILLGSCSLQAAANNGAGNIATYERVALIGDSHVEALGPRIKTLANKNGTKFKYEAHHGSKAGDWLREAAWGDWIDGFDPQMIVVNLGTNEAMSGKSANDLEPVFQKLADRLSSHGHRRVVWITPPLLEKPKNLNQVQVALFRLINVTLLDFGGKTYELRDGVHLVPKAYSLWAQEIATALKI